MLLAGMYARNLYTDITLAWLSVFTLLSHIYIPFVIIPAPILTFPLSSFTVSICRLHEIFLMSFFFLFCNRIGL